jgi:3,4-dihydroxy 2-butanone 4-phosphate synthase
MHEILADSQIQNKEMIMGLAPYGDYPTFSISVNHYQTYTGITDNDRSLTIREMAKIFHINNEHKKKKFTSSFKTPGHVPLLIASKGLLSQRQGHTEMSVYLAQIAGLTPVTAICEMMDAETYNALSLDKAEKYAKQNAIPLIDGKDLLEYAKVH